MRVLWLFNHPAPYKVDFFNLLGQTCSLTVLFERRGEKSRERSFYTEKAKNFEQIFIPGIRFGEQNCLSNYPIRLLKKRPFDIVVINGWSTMCEMKTIRYLKKHHIPYLFAINGGIAKINEPLWKRKLKQYFIPSAKAFLSPDVASSQYLVYYGADPSRIFLYPYSTIRETELVSAPLDAHTRYLLRQKEGIPGNELFVSVGSFISRKNNDQLLKIWKDEPFDRTLLLIGSGPEEKSYRDYIAQNHLENVIIKPFLPHKEILRYFAMADASVFLTKEDIYGHVVNECLSQGTPVIGSSKANAALKLLSDEKEGYLVDLSSARSIEEALDAPFDGPIRQNALEKAKANTLEEMVKAHQKAFEEFLAL